MRSLIALTALLFAACGAPEDLETATDSQALSPAALPAAIARCGRGDGALRSFGPIQALDPARLDLARRVTVPVADAAPTFLPVRLELRQVEIGHVGDQLHISANGLDPITGGAEGYGSLIVSTPDGTDVASFEPFGRCGAFWLNESVPFEGELPSEVQVEWRLPGGHAVRQMVEVW